MADTYTVTALWQDTLAPRQRHDDHAKQRDWLRTSYEALRRNVAILLAECGRSVPSLTVHDITHVDALWETASLICGDSNSLTPAEAYVLGCAFVLHDAAMGLASYRAGLVETIGQERWRDLLAVEYFRENDCWPGNEDLDNPPSEITDRCVVQAIRESHAEQAKLLVDQPWTSSAGNRLHLIDDVHLREMYGPLIGDLAASHWWDVDMLAERFKQAKGSLPEQPADWIIEPLKLACILRLADATQIDSRRAPTFLFALRHPQGISYHHWRFQEHVSRPQLVGDRITFTSLRPFGRDAADAWWLALGYLREVDRELKRVDALLYDLGRTRLAARAVAGVDSPERFAELFPVSGWRPIDAALQISDVPKLVSSLGGEQLYGRESEVAVRELIQNAHDAVAARAAVDPDFNDGFIEIKLAKDGPDWKLEVRDNGVGMDESIIVHGLLDFGNSGWSSNRVRTNFPGLAGSGFKPKGRFGIGFFAIFMLGDEVEVTTRRYDGAHTDARQVKFDGLTKRPVITMIEYPSRVPHGTTVSVILKVSPYDRLGIFSNCAKRRLRDLVQRLAIESTVPIRTFDPDYEQCWTHPPINLAASTAEEVFERLYPMTDQDRLPGWAEVRLQLHDAFIRRATELLDGEQNRIGLAALGNELFYLGRFQFRGIVPINGFLAGVSPEFLGYVNGLPNRASRDKADFAASDAAIVSWLMSQEQRLRELGEFDDAIQLELSYTFHRILGKLAEDHAVALTRAGVLRVGDVKDWAARRSEIFLLHGPPLQSYSRPARMTHYLTGADVPLPDNWVATYRIAMGLEFARQFPIERNRDQEYAFARDHEDWTWEREWWSLSGQIDGELIRRICDAWSCHVRDLLAPIEERHWNDFGYLEDQSIGPVFGYRFQRPSN